MELAAVLREMGISYDPQRLASALRGRELEISARALRITYSLGRFVASIAKVWLIPEQGSSFLPHTSSCSGCDCEGQISNDLHVKLLFSLNCIWDGI